jgi:competence ComEA-like helix-hairpin-helix protein
MKILALILMLAIDLNSATARELQSIPGVGPALARKIVEFRDKKGGFRRVEELLAVPGISEKKWNAIKDFVYVKPPNEQGEQVQYYGIGERLGGGGGGGSLLLSPPNSPPKKWPIP